MNLSSNISVVTKFWQRNYYEHVISNEKDLQNKTDYIQSNPLLWDEDDEACPREGKSVRDKSLL